MAETISIDDFTITYFGNSSFFVKAPDAVIYFDPLNIVSVSDEDKADVILISHAGDKTCSKEQIELVSKEGTSVFGPQSAEDTVGSLVTVMAEGGVRELSGVSVRAIPAYSEGRSTFPRDFGFGYEVLVSGKKLYFAGDTDLIPGMQDRENVDIAFLPIGGEGEMDFRDAADAVRMVRPKYVIPMSYDVGIDSPADNFKAAIDVEGVECIIMHPVVA
ncbi:MBL fold metallo-hydrolase [Patescibacteria group bacterium]|nr:MBL fold metallo-hydrolase [Patescibacteria group bacterium]